MNLIYFLHLICIFLVIKPFSAKAKSFLTKEELLTADLPPKGFGKYYVTVRYIEKCSSEPVDEKNKNIFNLTVKKHNETFEEFTGVLSIPNTHRCSLAKYTPMIKRNGVLKPSFNRTVENPCKDIIMSIPMKMIFNTDESCILHKGDYTAQNIDPNKWAHLALGENFMYERVHNILEYFTKYGSTFCFYVVVDIRPLPKNIRKKQNKKK